MKYASEIVWRTLASKVFQLTRETVNDPATYRVSVAALDTNQQGAGTVASGYFMIDYWGVPYSVIATGSGTVDIRDDYRVGRCPTSGQMALIYQQSIAGRPLYLSPDNFLHLHPMALNNSHKYDMAYLMKSVKKVPFTATETPTIATYQTTQVDPEDANRTINYAEEFGENPLVRCMITEDAANRYQLQQMPLFGYVDGLIDSIYFTPGGTYTGYILISRA